MNQSPFLLPALLLLLFMGTGINASSSETRLTPVERDALKKRIHDFYSSPSDPAPMTRYVPKTRVLTGSPTHPNARLEGSSREGWEKLAGLKSSESYRRAHRRFMARHFKARPSQRASVEGDDSVEALADSWTKVSYDLSALPIEGATGRPVWSNDYWKTQYGGTSYRYGEGKIFANYKEAVADYAQPSAFTALLDKISPDKITNQLLLWSPAEKYDLTVGDENFSLTLEEKTLGESELGPTGDVESWMGICHGWSAAAIMAPKPVKPATVIGAQGVPLTWYPDDIRALLSLSWANAGFDANNAGGRCNAKNPETYPNGRLKDQECFDTNPATLHLALMNLIGQARQSFIIDATFDYEVWNQPMKSYELTYFNPLKPDEQDKDWTKVAVDYDATFKAADRFQHPLTRGKWISDEKWDDSDVKKVVGVIATVVYLSENAPQAAEAPADEEETRVTYTYDLELHEVDGELVPLGGEWHENTHPDFLWVPRQDSVATADGEATELGFDPESEPGDELAQAAATASAGGQPLCQVVKGLLEAGGNEGAESYSCGSR